MTMGVQTFGTFVRIRFDCGQFLHSPPPREGGPDILLFSDVLPILPCTLEPILRRVTGF